VSFVHLFHHYGYWVVFIGTLLEGETVLVMAGFAAHRGHLHLSVVMLLAFMGSFFGDQCAYFLGRRFGLKLLARFPRFQKPVAHAMVLLERRKMALILTFRFLYGLRNVTPFAIGMTAIPPRHFVPLNALGAAVWAVAVAGAGYAFGQAFELFLSRARRFEEHALAAIAIVGLALLVIRHLRKPLGGTS
jgi:membrane protein DedA with SNARE-associated domain